MARRRRAILCVAVTLIFCFGGVAILQAQPPEPFVSISVPSKIDLGTVTPYGQQIFNSTIKVHITANCFHHIEASIGAFTNSAGDLIPTERTNVEMVPPPSVLPPTPLPEGIDVDINLKFTIDIESNDPAGEYTGTVVLTVTAG